MLVKRQNGKEIEDNKGVMIMHFFKKKESESIDDIRKRVLDLAEDTDCGIFAPPMDAQVALNELCRFLLGDDWYSLAPVSQEQINTEIVYEIELKYRNKR